MTLTCPCCKAKLALSVTPVGGPLVHPTPDDNTPYVFIGDIAESSFPTPAPAEAPVPYASFLPPDPSPAPAEPQPEQGVDIESLKCSDCEYFPTMPLGAPCRSCCKGDSKNPRLNYQLAANKRPGAMPEPSKKTPHEGCNGCKHVGLTFDLPPCDTCIAKVSGLRHNWEAL